jgi:hypothetical protein
VYCGRQAGIGIAYDHEHSAVDHVEQEHRPVLLEKSKTREEDIDLNQF